MPEHIAFISSKSGNNPCRDGRVSSLTRKECRQTDRQMAFQIYIAEDWIKTYSKSTFTFQDMASPEGTVLTILF